MMITTVDINYTNVLVRWISSYALAPLGPTFSLDSQKLRPFPLFDRDLIFTMLILRDIKFIFGSFYQMCGMVLAFNGRFRLELGRCRPLTSLQAQERGGRAVLPTGNQSSFVFGKM